MANERTRRSENREAELVPPERVRRQAQQNELAMPQPVQGAEGGRRPILHLKDTTSQN